MKKYTVLFALSFFWWTSAASQPFTREVEGIPVVVNGSDVALPFTGGVNSPNHEFVDIDGDGDYDLFVLDNDLLVDFYRNEGNRFAPNFKLRNGAIPIPPYTRWCRFLDFDHDGLVDVFTEDTTFVSLRLYRNTGTPQSPHFTLSIPTLLDTNGFPVFAGSNSIPAFADIDADSDYDFFSSNFDGTINFYRNIGTPAAYRYQFVTSFWQGIQIFGDSCIVAAPHDVVHGASAYRFADIDGNRTLDLFIGDFFSASVFSLLNIGTPANPHIVCSSNHFPPNSPVSSSGLNQVSLVDIDGDADLDMFIGVLGGIVQTGGFWFYRNTGTATAPLFQQITKDYLSLIDVGMNAHPAFVDIDADGDLDMIVGNLNGQLMMFRNTGSAGNPSFALVDTSYQNITGGFLFEPTFVDIDNDGDKDLFIGQFNGRIKFYRNAGTSQSAAFIAQTSPVDTIAVGQNSAPTFIDIDNDGDMDLFIGKGDGHLSFYRNIGSASNFIPVLQSASYQNITAGQNSVPTFVDIDNDGDFDLFIGTSEGRIEFYQNNGTPSNAFFSRVTNRYANTEAAREAAPAIVDIDNDGDRDIFLGVVKGGIHFYRNQLISTSVSSASHPKQLSLSQNYPNPFNPSTEIRLELSSTQHVTLRVYDILGREVRTLMNDQVSAGEHRVQFDGSSVASGVYIYQLITPTTTLVKSMMLLR
jgi:hypothetical protein